MLSSSKTKQDNSKEVEQNVEGVTLFDRAKPYITPGPRIDSAKIIRKMRDEE